MSDGHTDQLFEGILTGARAEARTIVERAHQEAALLRATFQRKIEEVARQEHMVAQQRIEQIRRHEESTLRNLQRRHAVSHGQRLSMHVLESVARRMASLLESEGYRDILVRWIAEAAVGLDRPEAIVNCFFREKVDETMLRESELLVRQATGKEISLGFGGAILTGQGVEVTSLDGKVAYNNQVSTRLVRLERRLKELMEGQACRRE